VRTIRRLGAGIDPERRPGSADRGASVILRPFLAILADPAKANAFGNSFRIVEVELHSNKVEGRLGVGGGASMLDWNTVMNLDDLKQAALLYDTTEAPDGSIHQGAWPGMQPRRTGWRPCG
jgi:hypothetical protein